MHTVLSVVKKKYEIILLAVILLVASFWRLYRIGDYLTFLGDEGRDVLVVRGILHGDLTLLGPRASAGDFFTGPIYYYMMTPFLWLFNYDPVGPAVMVALLGIATVFLVYYISKKFFGTNAGLIAAALYAISPLIVTYSRSSWNPNPMPFFSLVIILLLYKGVKEGSWKIMGITGLLFGIAFQLHYIELFFAVFMALFFFIGSYIVEKKGLIKRLLVQSIVTMGGFLVGFSPFLAFEVRHGFPNTRTIFSFILSGTSDNEKAQVASFFQIVPDVFVNFFARTLLYFPGANNMAHFPEWQLTVWKAAAVVVAVAGIIALFKTKDTLVKLLLFLWLVVGVGLFGFYKKPIYDYYFAFMFPLPFILVGNFFARIFENKTVPLIIKAASMGIVLFLIGLNLSGFPFQHEPNKQKDQMKQIAEFVMDKAGGKPFNFALITGGNSDHAYRYYFELKDRTPVTIENPEIDPERKTVTDQLFVVCESLPCAPLGHPLWEIAGFGSATISAEWDVSVVEIYKLTPYKNEGETNE